MEHLTAQLYSDEPHVRDLQTTLTAQLERAQAARDDLLLQCRPATATWGLTIYEREYGIVPDAEKTLAERLAGWRAKRRGRGTTTLVMVRGVAQSFSDAPVTVTEQPAQYRFTLRFAALDAGKLRGLRDAIEEIKPAHLTCNVLLQYAGASTPGLRLGGRQSVAVRVTVHPYVTPAITASPVLAAGGFLATGIRITV